MPKININMHQTSPSVCALSREMKMEKRSCSGIARVTPSIHMGPSAHPTSAAGKRSRTVSGSLIRPLYTQVYTLCIKNVLQESCEWRWTPYLTITPSQQTAAHPLVTPAPLARPGRHSAVTPPLTGPETFTGVSFLTGRRVVES